MFSPRFPSKHSLRSRHRHPLSATRPNFTVFPVRMQALAFSYFRHQISPHATKAAVRRPVQGSLPRSGNPYISFLIVLDGDDGSVEEVPKPIGKKKEEDQYVIIDEFVEVPTPSNGRWNTIMGFGALDGSLCHAHRACDELGCNIEVIVMQEYGVKESWTCMFAISGANSPLDWPYDYRHILPLCFTKNGEVMMANDRGKAFLYNTKEELHRDITMGEQYDYSLLVAAYSESLVSPAAYEQDEDWRNEGLEKDWKWVMRNCDKNYSWDESETEESNYNDWEEEEDDVLADWEDKYFLKILKSSRQKLVKGKENELKRTNCQKNLMNNQESGRAGNGSYRKPGKGMTVLCFSRQILRQARSSDKYRTIVHPTPIQSAKLV